LIEESRTNLLTYSEDFNSWTKFLASVSSNTATAPDGNTTADTVISNGGTTTGLVRQDVSGLSDNTTYTFSVFLKTAGLNIITLQFYNKANTFHGSKLLNLSTGALTGSDFVGTSSVVSYGNGWYRLIITNLGSGTGATTPNVRIVTTSIGNGTSGIYVWGAQLEAGSVPTSYIPTTASTVTRSVDNAEMTGTNFSSWYNQTEGTFFYNGTLPFITNDTVGRVPFGVSNGFNFSNSIYVAKPSATLGLSFNAINNNVSQTSGSSLPSMTSSKIKIAAAVADKNIYSSGYGGAINKFSRPSAIIPPATRLTLGKEPWNTSALNPIIGCINKFAYYPKALSPAELQYLTQ
jgi:hypothetical protein